MDQHSTPTPQRFTSLMGYSEADSVPIGSSATSTTGTTATCRAMCTVVDCRKLRSIEGSDIKFGEISMAQATGGGRCLEIVLMARSLLANCVWLSGGGMLSWCKFSTLTRWRFSRAAEIRRTAVWSASLLMTLTVCVTLLFMIVIENIASTDMPTRKSATSSATYASVDPLLANSHEVRVKRNSPVQSND